MLPEADVARVLAWAADQIPPERQGQARVEVDQTPRGLNIYLSQAPWHESLGPERIRQAVARLSWSSGLGEWKLLWMRASGRFEAYGEVEPTDDVGELLDVIDEDAYGAFWG